jgi:hypothetical protein
LLLAEKCFRNILDWGIVFEQRASRPVSVTTSAWDTRFVFAVRVSEALSRMGGLIGSTLWLCDRLIRLCSRFWYPKGIIGGVRYKT